MKKSRIAEALYGIFEKLDKAMGKYNTYSYETAPYCGHHRSGHEGYYTRSMYFEGEGSKWAQFFFNRIGVEINTHHGVNWYTIKPKVYHFVILINERNSETIEVPYNTGDKLTKAQAKRRGASVVAMYRENGIKATFKIKKNS